MIPKSGLLAAAIAALMAAGSAAVAQGAYPNQPVKVIVPYAAGGPVDAIGRPVLDKLQRVMGQPFVLDFRAGGATIVGTGAVARADPDGHTLLFTAAQHTINPSIHAKLPYDTIEDFAAVSQVAAGPLMLVVHPGVKATNLKELIELAKASPRKLNYASAGVGSAFHLAAEKLKSAAGIDMVHVPYKGGAPAANDLVGGHVDLMIGSSVVAPLMREGRLRLLGVTSARRTQLLPDAPTLAEQGLPGFEVPTWFGIFAPAKTPKPIVDRLAHEIDAILKEPEIVAHLRKFVVEPGATTPAAFDAIVRREVPQWIKVAKDAKIVAEPQ
jgi:tripartite-type tricarboxylate transporter receptor subunit TctC